jgi:hypothetical protein
VIQRKKIQNSKLSANEPANDTNSPSLILHVTTNQFYYDPLTECDPEDDLYLNLLYQHASTNKHNSP